MNEDDEDDDVKALIAVALTAAVVGAVVLISIFAG